VNTAPQLLELGSLAPERHIHRDNFNSNFNRDGKQNEIGSLLTTDVPMASRVAVTVPAGASCDCGGTFEDVLPNANANAVTTNKPPTTTTTHNNPKQLQTTPNNDDDDDDDNNNNNNNNNNSE